MTGTANPPKVYRAGQPVDDLCRACKEPREHRVIAASAEGQILRVICGYCGSQHNYRGNRALDGSKRPDSPRGAASPPRDADVAELVSERERVFEPTLYETGLEEGDVMDLEMLLRRVIREEAGLTPTPLAKKWRGGTVALRPGDPALQERVIPIEALFNKVVMIRNRLRVLEQQVNAGDATEEQKLTLQGYITACYGSLTTFNVLFAEEEDKFKGTGGT